MNVINKLKSKKNKQASSQLVPPSEQSQPSQQKYESQSTQAIPKPQSKVSLEFRSYSNVSQRSESRQADIDEINISQYYSRKDKKMQLISKIESHSFQEDNLKQTHYSLHVRKSFNIGDISVLEGELSHKKEGKEIECKKVKLSCSIDAIQFPETISKIVLSRVTMLNNSEGIFIGDDILKIAEKRQTKK